jgi:hypothetical protein
LSASYEEFLGLLVQILRTPATRPEDVHRTWRKLDPLLRRLEQLISSKEISKELVPMLQGLEKSAVKFLRSMTASMGALGEEWKNLALLDLEDLKEKVSALHEFLIENERELRHALDRAGFLLDSRLDPRKIFDELREAGAIGEHTWCMLSSLKRKELGFPEVQEKAKQLAQLLFELREVERGVAKEG